MNTELENQILKIGDDLLTEKKKDSEHITKQLSKAEEISYNTGYHRGFIDGANEILSSPSKYGLMKIPEEKAEKSDRTEVWVMPESKILLVDGYGAPPVESCNWSESTKKYVESLGFTGALYSFNTWNEALDFASDYCKKNPSWKYECSSPLGDLAASIALDNW